MMDPNEPEVGDCLYEDETLFVLYKPSGMLVHRGWARAEHTLVDFARGRTVDGAAHPIQRPRPWGKRSCAICEGR